MKRIMKKVIITFLIVFVATLIIFWGRISNSYEVYSLLNKATTYLDQGENNYNFSLNGIYKTAKSSDSLSAKISYQKDTYFLADVNFKEKKYIVKSDGDSTQVFIGPSNLIVSAKGSDDGTFDVVKLLGDILKDYPKTSKIPTLTFLEKVGISGWASSNCSFSEGEKNGEVYKIISIPIDSSEVQIWVNKSNDENFYLTSNFGKNEIDLKLTITNDQNISQIKKTESITILEIERKELNTAIYRGTLRVGGLLLTKAGAPKPDGIERTYGKGKLTYVDGNRVLLAKGTHKEIGQIEGALLKEEIRKMIDATLYTMCWVYTSKSKTWFIDDFREAYKRLLPFIPKRFEEEMEGMAETSGVPLDEIKLTNVFPALFHCSGFAVFNSATKDGKLYHGRILDYIVDLGLQFSSVVYIVKPDGYNAFANVGFAGFIGSVTGMNEKQVAFGEMGGGGVGDWDGMPMAFLMRDGLERANTLDEAITIFSETQRTCEYYYVFSDGKLPDARGLATTPTLFDVIKPNEYREKLDEPVEDAVIMSAGSRYKNLIKRIKENFGEIDSEKAIRLMDRPVAMKSDLHNALFAPQSLEFWVANAGVNTPACNEPYSHYNLEKLLKQLDEDSEN